MPYCSRCGVEVNREARLCPLCRSPIQKFDEDPAPGRTFPADELPPRRPPRMTPRERRRLTAVLTALGMLIPMLITLTVDLTLNARVSWSWYPLISLAAAFSLVLTALYSFRQPRHMIWMDVLICSVALLLMYRLNLVPSRAVRIGVPVCLFAALSAHTAVGLSQRSKRRGSNVGAFVLAAVGLFCVLTEIWIDTVLFGSIRPGWSLIVLGATQPVTLILLYLHYRKKKKNGPLSKYFHL